MSAQPDYWNFGRDVIDHLASTHPNDTALYFLNFEDSRSYTFSDMSRISDQTAAWLRDQGVSPQDRVLIVLGKDLAFWPVMVALNKLGAVAMPGTTQLTAKDLQYRLETSQARCAIVSPDAAEKIDEQQAPVDIRIIVGDTRPGWATLDPYSLSHERFSGNPTLRSDPTLIYFTSGTTGYPKMVLHNQDYPRAHTITARYWLGLNESDLHWNVSDTG